MPNQTFHTKIRLYSHFEGSPGGGAHPNLLFRRSKTEYEVVYIDQIEEHPLTLSRDPVTSYDPGNWRLFANFLLREKYQHGLTSPEELPEIFVYGLRSWRGEVLALCWARWDEDWPERCEILLELLSLPDSTLKATIGTFANCLTPAFGHARPACRVEQLLGRLVEIREQDPKFRDMKLVDLIDAFGARQADNPLVSVISALENEWAAFEEVIGSLENEIRRLVEVQVARLPAPRTWIEAMGRSSEASEIESAIIETLRETGTLPTS